MYNNTPLTKEQESFAAEHHNLIYSFLNKKNYSSDEYYDIAVFGYLAAVKSYLSSEKLREYAFSTIAYSRMRSHVSKHIKRESEHAQNHVSYDEYMGLIPQDYNTPERTFIKKECMQAINEMLTPCQKLALRLKCEGADLSELYAQAEIDACDIADEIRAIQSFVPELIEAIAA